MEKTKAELRKEFTEKRTGLSRVQSDEKSKIIVDRLVSTEIFKKAETVMIYNSVKNEVSLDCLPLLCESDGKKFVYPVCVSKTEIRAYLPGNFRKGAFGITEPDPLSSRLVLPEEIDLIICPGTAFDDCLNRLGMGGGYYDRFLKKCQNAGVVMVAFELQHAESLPNEDTDITMDMIITEKQIYKGENKNARDS